MPAWEFPVRWWFGLVAPLPALVLGVVLTQRNAVLVAIWGQNIVAGMFLMVVYTSFSLLRGPTSNQLRWGLALTGILAFGLLLATFVDAGLSGVHR